MTLLLAFASTLAHAGPSGPFPTETTLATSDGKSVAAVVGAPKGAVNGVVFVHEAGRSKEDWIALADKFYRGGTLVLAVDLRGHGANVTGEVAPTFGAGDYGAMVEDVKAGVAELRKRGAQKVAIVGAELGANLALVAAADDPGVVSLALLSPGMDYKGVVTGESAKRYGARPLLLIAGSDDTYGVRSANALDSLSPGPHTVTVLEKAGKGVRMFNRAPTLESQLLGFVTTAWTAAPVEASGPVDLSIKSEAMETSGKRIGSDLAPPAE